MTNSQFCIQQRQQEQQRLRKLLIVGFVGSAALHGILAYALPRWSFEPPQTVEKPMELVLVDKPKPKPKPKPKVESKPVVKPKPVKPPEQVKAQTPPPPVKPPEPIKAQTPPPKPVPEPAPAPKPVVSDPTPTPSQPIVSVPIENTGQSSSLSSITAPNSSVATADSNVSSNHKPGSTGSVVAANSAPPRPEANDGGEEGISCVSNCEPEYPAALDGVEGNAGVKLTLDSNGNVVGAELVDPDSDPSINRQALLAARQMQFSSPGDTSAAVRVNIDFTVAGSQYDRARREEQARREQAERERKEQEAAARQQQLERERQAREQLERERQARQQELQQQQEATPLPAETKPAPKPLPAPSPEELDAERLRKFRERIENYQ